MIYFWLGLNYYHRNCFLSQAFDLFCINRLQGEVYLKEGDFSSVSKYSGYTIYSQYKFLNLNDTHFNKKIGYNLGRKYLISKY